MDAVRAPEPFKRDNYDNNPCWYHNNISRDEAENLLQNLGKGNGSFLIRDSNTSSGDFVLSVSFNNEIYHYQIRRHGMDALFSIHQQKPIHGLDCLIQHYQQSSDQLVTKLSDPVQGFPLPEESRRHSSSQSLLHRSIKEGNLFIVNEVLLSNSTKINAKDQNGRTAVHLACLLNNNQAEIFLESLIRGGATVNSRDVDGNTPLHYACRTKPATFIQMLVDAGACINVRNTYTERVPLHEAAINDNFEAVKLLLELGGPHMPRCVRDITPAQFARYFDHTTVAEYLDKYTPSIKTTSTQWYHGTLSRSDAEMVMRRYAQIKFNNKANASGTFLIRYSEEKSLYILGLISEDKYQNMNRDYKFNHYVISQSSQNHWFIDGGPYMLSLGHLVEHYMRSSDGLRNKLHFHYPVKPKPKPQFPPPPPLPPFRTSQYQRLPKTATEAVVGFIRKQLNGASERFKTSIEPKEKSVSFRL